jgi:predicted nucleotide-binding protein (sugar kinase/HSP70/actin superfamily)
MKNSLVEAALQMGLSGNPEKAWRGAEEAQKRFHTRLLAGALPHEIDPHGGEPADPHWPSPLTVGLVGHGYNLYDRYLSMNLIDTLRGMGVRVVTPDNLSPRVLQQALERLPKRLFWTLGKNNLGSVLHWLQGGKVSGIIHVSSFGCGPDSLVGEMMERFARRSGLPHLFLNLDEHTGEAGIITRVEAFVDMLEVKGHKNNLSPHGEPAYSP